MHGADLFADAPERPAVHCPVDRTVVRPVAALCVAPNSGYKNMDAVECYDMARDVRTFTGGMPVVAHPPCRTWSAYTAHQAKAPPRSAQIVESLMAETTGIAWTDSTFNPWIGCTKVSPGCDNCYASVSTPARSMRIVWGAGQPRHRTSAQNWKTPGTWNDWHEAFKAQHGRRRRVFCASLADVFDNEVPNQWRADLFALIDRTPHLDWLLLTKRVGNVLPMLLEIGRERLPVNVWQGISAVNQEEARRDLPKLARLEATVRWVSYEPALGELDLFDTVMTKDGPRQLIEGLDWVIAGGESGPKARPIRREWVDLLREQCDRCGVAFFFKQWGGATATAGGCELDGAEVKAWPCAA